MSAVSAPSRRLFLGTAALGLTAAAAPLALASTASAATVAEPAGSGRVLSDFGPLRQVDAGLLNVGYVDVGPSDGRVVILLHGWPYDIHAFADVVPRLVAAGFRVIVPHLRGHGSTRFLSRRRRATPSRRRWRWTSSR